MIFPVIKSIYWSLQRQAVNIIELALIFINSIMIESLSNIF